jgi:hypothetical protein
MASKLPGYLSLDDPVVKQIADLTGTLFGAKKGKVTLRYLTSFQVDPVTFKVTRTYKTLSLFDSTEPMSDRPYRGIWLSIPTIEDQITNGQELLIEYICLVES